MTTDITELATVLRLAAESEIAYRAEGDTSDLWQDEASPDNVLVLVEALEKAQQRIDELENDEVRQRLANAEHQLYMAELAKHNLKASRKAQFRKRKAAEKRIAELESRTVTVKLPSERFRYGDSDYDDGFVNGWNARMAEDTAAIDRVGIKWEAE